MIPKKDSALFTPAGPLAYLLMDKEGNPRLGLYHDLKDNSLVIIGDCYGKKYVFYPSGQQLDNLMQGKSTLDELLLSSPCTTTGKEQPEMIQKIVIRYWILKEFKGLLSRQDRSVPYLNYYYVYQEYLLNTSPIRNSNE
jgi:hypothetical protein